MGKKIIVLLKIISKSFYKFLCDFKTHMNEMCLSIQNFITTRWKYIHIASMIQQKAVSYIILRPLYIHSLPHALTIISHWFFIFLASEGGWLQSFKNAMDFQTKIQTSKVCATHCCQFIAFLVVWKMVACKNQLKLYLFYNMLEDFLLQ